VRNQWRLNIEIWRVLTRPGWSIMLLPSLRTFPRFPLFPTKLFSISWSSWTSTSVSLPPTLTSETFECAFRIAASSELGLGIIFPSSSTFDPPVSPEDEEEEEEEPPLCRLWRVRSILDSRVHLDYVVLFFCKITSLFFFVNYHFNTLLHFFCTKIHYILVLLDDMGFQFYVHKGTSYFCYINSVTSGTVVSALTT
jgi:hypothetical protein